MRFDKFSFNFYRFYYIRTNIFKKEYLVIIFKNEIFNYYLIKKHKRDKT